MTLPSIERTKATETETGRLCTCGHSAASHSEDEPHRCITEIEVPWNMPSQMIGLLDVRNTGYAFAVCACKSFTPRPVSEGERP